MFETKDFEFTLDSSGKIIQIHHTNDDLIDVELNSTLFRYLSEQSHKYFLEAIHYCHQNQFELGEEIMFNTKKGILLMAFILFKEENNIRFINLNESKKTLQVLEEIIKINNELTNSVRRTYQTSTIETEYQEYLQEISKLNSELVNMQRMMTHKNRELSKVNKVLENLSLKDDLTEIGNRRKFFRDIQELEDGKSYVLLMIDFNHFKKVNDTRGHEYGDYVLKTFSKELNAVLSPCGGELYRIGGDEFAVIILNNSCIDLDHHFVFVNKRLKELHPDISLAYGKEIINKSLVNQKKIEKIMSEIDFKMYTHKDFYKANNQKFTHKKKASNRLD